MSPPSVAGLLLAAGHSHRMGDANKLLLERDGVPMLRMAAQQLLGSSCRANYVVTGFDSTRVAASLSGLAIEVLFNPEHACGMGTSLALGARHVPEHYDGLLICLADMPLVTIAAIDRLVSEFSNHDPQAICVPVACGKRGHPVLFGRQHFPALARLNGDSGARRIVEACAHLVIEVEMDSEAVLCDVDTPEHAKSMGFTPAG